MKRHADSLAPTPSRPGPVRSTIGSVVMVCAASAAIVVTGALLLLASGSDWHSGIRVVLSVAAAPWALAVVVWVGASWRLVLRAIPPDIDRPRAEVQAEAGRPEPVQIWVSHEREDGNHGYRVLEVPGVSPEQLRQFATSVNRGATLTVSQWTGNGALFSRQQYDALMSELQRAGWVSPGAGNQPRQLTAAGRQMIRRMAQ